MTPLDTALKYMDIFFSAGDLAGLAGILSRDLVFEGPFHRFESAAEYIDCLRADPPAGCGYRLIKAFETTGSVNLIYEFTRGDLRTPMSQLFQFEGEKISRILLIFDTGPFT